MTGRTEANGAAAVAAELGVLRTLADYCQSCDDGRFDDFAQCFTPDAVVCIGATEVRGRQAVRDWIARAMPAPKRGRHIVANPIVTVDGDRAQASSDFMFLAKGQPPRITTAGRYLDELRHNEGRWQLARREIVLLGSEAS